MTQAMMRMNDADADVSVIRTTPCRMKWKRKSNPSQLWLQKMDEHDISAQRMFNEIWMWMATV